MKRKLAFLMSLIAVCALIAAGCSGTLVSSNSDGAEGKVIEMNVSNFNPSTSHFAYNVLEPWKELVEEKTDGRVVVNLYHGGTLGSAKTTLEDISGGIADVGMLVSTYYYDSEFFPLSIGNLPFAFPDAEVASKIMTEFGNKYISEAFNNVQYMGVVSSTDAYDIFSTKPIKTLKDVKNIKMKVAGKGDSDLVKSWGAVPVSIAIPEIYESLQKGTLTAAPYSPIGGVGHKLYESGPYFVQLGIAVTPFVPIMNKSFYEKLPADLKEVFDEELNPALGQLFNESYVKELEVAHNEIRDLVKDKGEYIVPADGDLKEFKALSKGVWEDWVKTANEKGYPGDEMMEDFIKLLEAEGLELPY